MWLESGYVVLTIVSCRWIVGTWCDCIQDSGVWGELGAGVGASSGLVWRGKVDSSGLVWGDEVDSWLIR